MTKLLYPIYKLPQRTYERNIPTWVKYWLYTKSFIENVMELSEILTGSEFTLLNTVSRKFKIFELSGRTEQEGSTPSPECESPVKVVTGENTIKIVNKNLLPTNENDWEQGTFTTDGQTASSTIRLRTKEYCEIKPNVDYYISVEDTNYCFVNIFFYDKNNNFVDWYFSIDNYINGSTSKNIKIPTSIEEYKTITKMKILLRKTDYTTILPSEISTIKPMMVYGDTDTTYTEHQEQNYPISLGDIELCKIGDYQDYIYNNDGSWYIKKNIGKIDLGNISWNRAEHNIPNYSRYYTNTISNLKYVSSNTQVGNGLAEKYRIVKGQGISDVIDCLAIDVSNVSVCDKTTPSGLFYYALETTEDIPITDTTLIEQLDNFKNAYTYKDITNISGSSSELEPNLVIQYWKRREAK